MEPEILCEAKNEALLKEKHRQIAEAAAPLFTRQGFHQTTMRQIARATGMSMGNLYHYINSKDDVLFLVYRELYRNWEDGLSSVRARNIEDPVERLRHLVSHLIEVMRKDKELVQMTFREAKFLERTALQRVLSMESEFIRFFIQALEDGIRQGVFRDVDPAITGNILAYNMFFFPLRGWFFRGQMSSESIGRQMMDFLLHAIQVNPETPAQHSSELPCPSAERGDDRRRHEEPSRELKERG